MSIKVSGCPDSYRDIGTTPDESDYNITNLKYHRRWLKFKNTNMKNIFLVLWLLLAGLTENAMAQVTMTAVDSESKIAFKIRNLGFNVSGSFKGLNGTLVFDPANPLSVKANMSVEANTINTGIGARDKHLRKEEYFGVDAYKKISFVSTGTVNASKAGTYILSGDLTIKKTTKRVSIPFTVQKKGNGFLFEGSFEINRRDFDVGGSSLTLSDDLTVNLSVLVK